MTTETITFITTRAQFARLKPVLVALKSDSEFNSTIVLSGGATVHNFGELAPVLEANGLNVDYELSNLLDGGTPITQAKTTGLELIEYANIIDQVDPDTLLVTGDRHEIMAATLAASYQNIPVCHFEGGEITGSIDEKVRHATTKMSDYHFVSTSRSAEIVKKLGENEQRVFQTGCPSIDIARQVSEERENAYDPTEEYGGVGGRVDVMEPYILVQYHPLPTEYQSNYNKTWELINAIKSIDVQAFWFWPNMDAGTDQVSKAIREFRERDSPERIRFFINLEPEDYLTLAKNASCVVGNSSVAIRECAYFGTPAVNIGDRQSFRERGPNVVDVFPQEPEIEAAISKQLSQGDYEPSTIYGDGFATKDIVNNLKQIDLEIKSPMNPSQMGVLQHPM